MGDDLIGMPVGVYQALKSGKTQAAIELLCERLTQAERELDEARARLSKMIDAAIRYDEAVGRKCQRDLIISDHDELRDAIAAARGGESDES